MAVTRVEDLARTIDIHREVFKARGLERAWERVLGVVVQRGVEFDHARVIDYQPERAKALSEAILRHERLVYEAHSTDYQTEAALTNLVRGHFAILKVGPGLTYATREALFALSHIEQELGYRPATIGYPGQVGGSHDGSAEILRALLWWNRSRTRIGAQIQLQGSAALLLARPDRRSQLSSPGQEFVGPTRSAFVVKPICALSIPGNPEGGIEQ